MSLSGILGAFEAPLLAAMQRFGMGSPLERAHFLAQVCHETGGLRCFVENLDYSSSALLRCWPSRFTPQSAAEYAHKPEAIANKVYANRFGNGAPASGDGWRYRGRGMLQTTFADNYRATSLALYNDARLVLHPELLEQPEPGALAAAHYWNARHLGIHAMRDDLTGVTRGVNGGTNGLDDRRVWLLRLKAALGVPA